MYGSSNNTAGLLSDARAASRMAGFDPAAYDLDVVAFRRISAFSWAGLGRVGAAGTWINGSFGMGVLAHELGHNFGLPHANFWQAGGETIIGTGNEQEYGNPFDTMGGGGGMGHFGAWYKPEFLDWLEPAQVARVTVSNTFRVADLEQPSIGQQQALEVPMSAVRSYWVEYRPASGGLLSRGAVITWGGRSVDNSVLLDMQPQTVGAGDAVLPVGRTFSDAAGGIHITPTGVNGTAIDITVNRGVFPSNRNPAVTLMPSVMAPAPGQAVTFTAMATDPDGYLLAYFWEVSGDTVPSTNTNSITRTFAVAREVAVRVVVSDMKGGVGSANLPLTVGTVSTVRIAGRVTEAGQGVEGARIVAGMRTASTDSNGAYVVVGVLPGPVSVSAVRPGFTLSPTFTNPLMVGNMGAANIDFTASRAGFGIFGRVTSIGMPLAGATVSAGPYSAITNGTGDYELRNIPNGQYNVAVSAVGGASFEPSGFTNPVVVNGVAVTGRNFIERAQNLTGVVTGEAGPHTVTDGLRTTMTSLQAGQWRFALPRVAFGTYHLVATAPGQRIVPMFMNPVSVTAAPPPSFSFVASLGAVSTVSGRITELGSGLPDTTVRLTNAASMAFVGVVTDSDGRFAFPNQEDGSYMLAPMRPGYTFGPATLPVMVAGAPVPNQDFIVQGANARPVIVVRPSANPAPVVGTMADLTVLADDPAPGSEGDLTYTWVQTFGPAPSMLGRNGDNAAKSTPVAFPRSGAYGYKVTATDPGMLSVSAELTVVVPQTPTTARVTSSSSSPLTLSETRQFVVSVVDQFGQPIEAVGDVEWAVEGGCGMVSQFGRFTAGTVGSCSVVASVAGLRGTAMVTVQVSRIPRIIGEPTVMPSPVMGSNATAVVTADDDMGESNLVYTWSALNPPAAVTFAANGTNAAKTTSVRFSAPGIYRLQVDVRDQQGNEAQGFTSAVNVTNGLASLVVTPGAATLPSKGTTRVSVRGTDFAGATVMVSDCSYATTAGSIDMNGTFTAPDGMGTATITATCNGLSGGASVSWSADAPRGCGCSGVEGSWVMAVGLLGTLRRRRRLGRVRAAFPLALAALALVGAAGCSGTASQGANGSYASQTQPLGEVSNGYPADQERMLHVLVNQARVGGQGNCDDDAGLPERRLPLVYTREANTAARFSARHMAENGCFQNESCCALGDAGMGLGCIGQGACSGMACGRTCDAGVGQSAANRFVAAGFTSYLTSAISRGVPSAQTLYCRFLTNDGIRAQMRVDAGTEFSAGVFANSSLACTEPYWTIAYGSGPQTEIPRIPVGSVMHAAGNPPTNASEMYFAASYFDSSGVAPRRAAVVVAGHCFDMDRRWGYDDNGTYETRFSDPDVIPAGCHLYYFLFTDSAGRRHTYPSSGSLQVAVGTDQTCPLAYDPAPQQPADCETGEMQCPAGAARRCYTADMANLGVGECRQGTQRCRNGFWGACRDQISPFTESCDGLDNDCDGQIDEGNPGGGASCMLSSELGACQAGTRQCTSGRLSCVPTTQPTAEVCDGIDNDCDGAIDDGFGQVSCGVGECFRLVMACEQGRPVACDGGSGSPEVDDGKDNDCNGLTDEGVSCLRDGGFGQTRTFWPVPGAPLAGRCMQGLQTCQEDGGWLQTRAPVIPSAETCNGLDDDCDGIEERDRVVQLLLGYQRCGVGACTIRTSSRCISGRMTTCMPDPSSAETCDGLDNNCDGTIDEMCSCRDADTRPCYTGPSETRGVGLCRPGLRTCVNGRMTACLTADAGAAPDAGEVRPSPELCNGLDDDCDGVVDDACILDDGGVPGTGGSGGTSMMGGTGGTTKPGGCGCSTTEGAMAMIGLAGAVVSRRRKREGRGSPV